MPKQPDPWNRPERLSVADGCWQPTWTKGDPAEEPELEKQPPPPHLVEEVEATCRRCRSRRAYVVSIHGGQSERVDCAYCGAFVEFRKWNP